MARNAQNAVAAVVVTLLFTFSEVAFSADSASDYYEDARQRATLGDINGAIIQLKNALQQDSQHVPSLLLTADIYLAEGEAPLAELNYAEALLLGADPGHTVPKLAEAYLLQGKLTPILDDFQPANLPRRANAEVLGFQAMAYLQQRRRMTARAAIDQALALAPEARAPRMALGQLLAQEGNLSEAVAATTVLVQDFPRDARAWSLHASMLNLDGRQPESLTAYGRALTLNDRLPSARFARAAIYIETGNLDAAAEDIAALADQRPLDPRVPYLDASLHSARGNPSAAQASFQLCTTQLAALEPEQIARDFQLTMMGAIAHLQAGEVKQARSYLENFHVRSPRQLESSRLLARLMLAEGDLSAALALLVNLRREFPDDPGLQSLQAQTLSEAGEQRRASLAWQKVLRATQQTSNPTTISASQGHVTPAPQTQPFALLAGDFETKQVLLQAYLATNNPAAALSLADDLLREHPDNLQIALLRAHALLQAGEQQQAMRLFQSLAAAHPDSAEPVLAMTQVYLESGEVGSAKQMLDAFDARHPEQPQVLLGQAKVAEAEGQLTAARSLIQRAMDIAPSLLAARHAMVKVLWATGDLEAAEGLARSTEARFPGSFEGRQLLIDLLAARGKTEEQRSLLRLMVRQALTDPDQLYLIAQLQARSGFIEDARDSLTHALILEPDWRQAQNLRARLELELGNLDLAQNLAENVATRKASASPLLVQAEIAQRQNRQEDAVALADEARRLEPHNRDALLMQYRVRLANGDRATAEALARDWLNDNPQDSAVRSALADFYIEQEDWSAAQRELEIILTLTDSNPLVLNNLAWAMLQAGDPAALPTARRARDAAPEHPLVIDTLGWILVQQGQPREGAVYLRESILRKADNPSAMYHLAVALLALDQRAEARTLLTEATQLSTSFAEHREAATLLQALDSELPE